MTEHNQSGAQFSVGVLMLAAVIFFAAGFGVAWLSRGAMEAQTDEVVSAVQGALDTQTEAINEAVQVAIAIQSNELIAAVDAAETTQSDELTAAVDTAIDAQTTEISTLVEEFVIVVADAVADGQQAAAPQEPQVPTEPQIIDVSVDDDPFVGPEDAPITIVEFSDYRCGYCGRFHQQTFGALIEQYGEQIRFVYRDFPVVGGERAAMAAQCVFAQGNDLFWEYHDLLFANQGATAEDSLLVQLAGELDGIDLDTMETCLSENSYADEIQGDFEDGMSYGVRGTPTFYINGQTLVGAQPLAAFQSMIDAALEQQQ